jgi:hypothetical protein
LEEDHRISPKGSGRFVLWEQYSTINEPSVVMFVVHLAGEMGNHLS